MSTLLNCGFFFSVIITQIVTFSATATLRVSTFRGWNWVVVVNRTDAFKFGDVPVGERCNRDSDCVGYPEATFCKVGTCWCNSDHIIIGDENFENLRCVPIRYEIGETCEDKEQCIGALGQLGDCLPSADDPTVTQCLCGNDATNEPGENLCRQRANSVGDPCLRNAQCKANLGDLSECLMGEVCVCTPNYGVPNMLGNRCLPVINFVGGECEERQQCTQGTPGPYSDCLESPIIPDMKICNCSKGAEHEPGRHECRRPTVLIGYPCEDDEQCVGEPGISSACDNHGLCGCLGGHIPSIEQDNCLIIRNQIGDSCEEDAQCQQGIPGRLSGCIQPQGVCNCTQYSVNEPGQHFCHQRAALVGDLCQVNIQCEVSLGEYSYCLGGQCQCKRGSESSEDHSTCVPMWPVSSTLINHLNHG